MRNSVLGLSSDMRFYYCRRPVNMLNGIEGLKGLVINEFGQNPEDGSVYVFRSANGKTVKLLHYGNGAYTLYTRRVCHGRFDCPKYDGVQDAYVMDWRRLVRLVCGRRRG